MRYRRMSLFQFSLAVFWWLRFEMLLHWNSFSLNTAFSCLICEFFFSAILPPRFFLCITAPYYAITTSYVSCCPWNHYIIVANRWLLLLLYQASKTKATERVLCRWRNGRVGKYAIYAIRIYFKLILYSHTVAQYLGCFVCDCFHWMCWYMSCHLDGFTLREINPSATFTVIWFINLVTVVRHYVYVSFVEHYHTLSYLMHFTINSIQCQ